MRGANVIVGLSGFFLIVPNALHGQAQRSASARDEFEVASIKPNNTGPGEGGVLRPSPNGLNAVNMPFKALVSWAYNVRNDLMTGPDWINAERYDISARAPDDAPIDPKRIDALRSMLQKLLEERFRLMVHREMKDFPVYAIVVAKNGPKRLNPAEPGTPSMMQPGPFGPKQEQHWSLKNTSMANFAGFLSRPQLDRPVVDLTGLTGGFDFAFDYPPRDPDMMMLDYLLTEVFPAVADQLGLRVEPRKAPMEVLVFDHADKTPTDN
jgi:uncharacterized protein (TIGR03435 family)